MGNPANMFPVLKKAQIEGKRRQEAEAAWEETLLVKKEEFIKNYKSDWVFFS